jgi:alanyl-tRNA synthetase
VGLLEVPERVRGLLHEESALRQQLERQHAASTISVDEILSQAEVVGDVTLIVAHVPGANPDRMRQLLDQLRQKAPRSVVLLAAIEEGARVTLVSGVSRALLPRGLHAGNWVREIAPTLGGGGGGRPEMAQAGGKHPENLDQALTLARTWMRQQIESAKASRT